MSKLDLIKNHHRSCGGCVKINGAESEDLIVQIIENDKR